MNIFKNIQFLIILSKTLVKDATMIINFVYRKHKIKGEIILGKNRTWWQTISLFQIDKSKSEHRKLIFPLQFGWFQYFERNDKWIWW